MTWIKNWNKMQVNPKEKSKCILWADFLLLYPQMLWLDLLPRKTFIQCYLRSLEWIHFLNNLYYYVTDMWASLTSEQISHWPAHSWIQCLVFTSGNINPVTVTPTCFQKPNNELLAFYRPLHLIIKLSNMPRLGSMNIQQSWFQSYSLPPGTKV